MKMSSLLKRSEYQGQLSHRQDGCWIGDSDISPSATIRAVVSVGMWVLVRIGGGLELGWR